MILDLSPLQPAADGYSDTNSDSFDMQSYAVRWILKTRETRGLSRDGIVNDVQDLVDHVTKTLRDQSRQTLLSQNADQQTMLAVDDVFLTNPVTKPFDGVSTFHQQLQYCRRHFDFVVRKTTSQLFQCLCNHLLSL